VSKEVDGKVLRRLEEWKREEGQLPDFVELYKRLLRLQCEVKSLISGRGLAKEVISERLERGIPLQPFHELPIDWTLLQNLLQQVLVTIASYPLFSPEEITSLRKVVLDYPLLKQIVEAWYEGKSLPALTGNTASGLLPAIIRAGIWPFLTIQSEMLLPQVDQERWRKRYCPICGGRADFCFLEKENGARWLSCSRCDTEWLFQRLECPYCGNQNQDKLAYFTDEEGLYRLYICEECRSYIKGIDLRKTASEVLLPLEKVITIELDNQAQNDGYKPGWIV